jgi:hypothetical protein
MPDISMCAAKCPVSKKCYRHPDSGTEPTEWRQAWRAFEPTDGVGCKHFILSEREPPTHD